MKRNLFFLGILALVAFLVWSGGKVPAVPLSAPAETPGPPTPCEACASATRAALAQEKINLSALQAQATATADILRAHTLATSNAASSTQSVAETQAMLNANVFWAQVAVTPYRWQADTLATANAADATQSAVQTEADPQQARLLLTSGAATQTADAAAAQQKMDQTVSGTAAAIAVTGLQAQSDITQKPEPSTVLWMWLTPILIIVAAVLTLWGVSRWQAHRRTGDQSGAPR
jgi:hypothetical protein